MVGVLNKYNFRMENKMNKKISVGITLSLMIIASAITFIITSNFTLDSIDKKVSDVNQRDEIYQKLDNIDSLVKNNFYGKVSDDDISNGLAEGFIYALNDQYASYNSSSENEERTQKNDGTFIGIGITTLPDESGYILVEGVMDGSPAKINNIEPGTLIVSVNGESVISLGYEQAVENIKGQIGTDVTITIRQDGVDKDVILTRNEIDIRSVNFKMIDNIAYIQITTFNNKTKDQFNYALQDAKDNEAKAIIFDLRNNLGGLLDPTLDMLDTLLPSGIIATETDKNGKETVLRTSDSQEVDLPMVCLTNSRTASAAELFASALRDYDKAQLVGTTTYGKGIMQDTFPLSDGSSVTFTDGTFNTPQTDNFNGIGLKPNYEVSMKNDTAEVISKLDETTDGQLKKAIEVLGILEN